jgi:alpha-glucosidase
MIRMEWATNGVFDDRASFVFLNRRLAVPAFKVICDEHYLVIQTDSLTLKYRTESGRFSTENIDVAFRLNGREKHWHPGMRDTANLRGTTRTLDGVEGSTALEPGLMSRDGWTIIEDSDRPLLDGSDWPWALPRDRQERQDWYFFGYGHDYRKTLEDFVSVGGRIPMPPRFAFGTWWSRYWAYTDVEFKDLVRQFESHSVPLDVLVIDMDWHQTFNMRWNKDVRDQAGQRVGWTGYTWDRTYFPDPPGFLSWCHEHGLKTTLNIHPASGIQPHEEVYPAMAKAMGIDPASRKYVPFDITNKKFATNYMDIVMHGLQHQGIDFFWLDWQQWATTQIPGVTPIWWLNYVFFTDMERQERLRPLLFHRWGGLGNHRYQIGFSGDVISVWASLAFQPYFTATAANVGFGYWSHDIGGHMPGVVSPELYTRWIQFGVFSPILRTHTTKNPEAERRIWAYPADDFRRMRDSFLRRYALIPYLYTASRRTYETGIALCHPLYYDYPEFPEAYDRKDEYLFGDAMLVSPVAVPVSADSMLTAKSVWLPPGDWFEWDTGTLLHGDATLQRCFALDEVPVYLRAGAIVPMQHAEGFNSARPLDPLVIAVAPGASGTTEVYEDEGNTIAYKQEKFAWTRLSQREVHPGLREIIIGKIRGSFPGMLTQRSFEIAMLASLPPKKVEFSGTALGRVAAGSGPGWWYDGDRTTLHVLTPRVMTESETRILIEEDTENNRSAVVNGLPGKIARLNRVMPLLNHLWPQEWSPESLVAVAQTGNRLSIEPSGVGKELGSFEDRWGEVLGEVRAMSIPDSVKERVLHHLLSGH